MGGLMRLLRPWFFFLAMLLFFGCDRTDGLKAGSESGDASAVKEDAPAVKQEQVLAKISASPNPVPAGRGPGSTTITWDTGDGSWGQIYIARDGGDEAKMLAQGARGSKEINWIKAKAAYEFRLYAGKDRQVLLGKVAVTRAEQ